MDQFTISKIQLYRISVPLKQPFSTHLQTVTERESIIVKMNDISGVIGLGECVAFSSPWYTEETVKTCWDALVKWLIPLLIGKKINHPSEVTKIFSKVKGNRMAKAALDQAAWDLFARKKGRPLWRLLGGVKSKIDAGIVLTGTIDEEMFEDVRTAVEAGYKRIKVKIDERTEPQILKNLVESFKSTLFFADANGLFSNLGMDALFKFDSVGLTLIEQPFGEDEWDLHIEATRLMKTPIALDESIRSVRDALQMAETRAGSVIVLKPGRVGGITKCMEIIDVATKYDLPIWIGGMIEFGVSKAHNLGLASLQQFSLPGDFSASNHFWDSDPVEPNVTIEMGGIQLGDAPGIGVSLNDDVLEKYTIDSYEVIIGKG